MVEEAGARPAVLGARSLVRAFGPIRAVNGVDFSLEAGTFLTVFGPNGAGKSTLIRVLSGALRPTSGEVLVNGGTARTGDPDLAVRIGVLSHRGFLYRHLTAAENLRFYGRLFGLQEVEDRVRDRLSEVGLSKRADDEAGTFSRGMRQRLALARCLLHDPEIVFLDEPYTGLDAHAADVLRAVLAALKDGRRTVLLVTHALRQGLELADRVVVQVAGRWVMDRARRDLGSVTEFESDYRALVEAHG